MIKDYFGDPIFKGSWVCFYDFYRKMCYGKVVSFFSREEDNGDCWWIEMDPWFQSDIDEPIRPEVITRADRCFLIYGPNDSR